MNQPEFSQAVISLSGGMDSTSLLLNLVAQSKDVVGISFDYGQRHRAELECLRRNLDYLRQHGMVVTHHEIDLSALGRHLDSALTDASREIPLGYYESESMKTTVVPNRNAIFASIVYAFALSWSKRSDRTTAIALGIHSGDHAIYPDCRPEFYDRLLAAFAAGNWDSDRVTTYLPYLEWDKPAILRDAMTNIDKLGLDFDTVFANTSTSYLADADGTAHGLTGSDVERILAFEQMGKVDPVRYQHPWAEVVRQAKTLRDQFSAQARPNESSER